MASTWLCRDGSAALDHHDVAHVRLVQVEDEELGVVQAAAWVLDGGSGWPDCAVVIEDVSLLVQSIFPFHLAAVVSHCGIAACFHMHVGLRISAGF